MMTLDFTSQTPHDSGTDFSFFETSMPDYSTARRQPRFEPVKLIADKLVVPPSSAQTARPRLSEHLEKSAEQFGATLLCGRAGAGKTALASDFAHRFGLEKTAWYKIEAADVEWTVFYSYLASCLNRDKLQPEELADFIEQTVNAGVEQATASLSFFISETETPLLVVLDDLHSVYDAEWFPKFFSTFLPLFDQDASLLLIARSLPPVPLWRLRSKQKLSVIEESLLAFTLQETIKLFADFGLCAHTARSAHDRSYGRIGKLLQFVELLEENNSGCTCAKSGAAKYKRS